MFIAMPMETRVLSDSTSITYAYYQQHIKPAPVDSSPNKGEVSRSDGGVSTKRWVCDVCGYVYEGEKLPEDFICPLCKHGASDFSKVE